MEVKRAVKMEVKRSVDSVGRLVLPHDYRNKLGIVERSVLNISLDGDKLIVEKSEIKVCEHCGSKY